MFTSEKLIEGSLYTRIALKSRFSITDATINNGVFRPKGHDSVWLFVTEQKTQDRPQLTDRLDGDTLYWDGQPKGGSDRLIIGHANAGLELLIFYRKRRDEFPNYGFRYEGCFRYVSHTSSRPTHFVLHRAAEVLSLVADDIAALQAEETLYEEGARSQVLTNRYERDPRLRAAAIRIHGTRCQVCTFSFEECYGERGKDYIEVHHLRPLASYQGAEAVNPHTEMAVLCANCHRMIHRRKDSPLSPVELRTVIDHHRV